MVLSKNLLLLQSASVRSLGARWARKSIGIMFLHFSEEQLEVVLA